MPVHIQDRKHFTLTDIRARGWTPRLIKGLLGPECTRLPNPHHAAWPQMRLWAADRVRRAERSLCFVHRPRRRGSRTGCRFAYILPPIEENRYAIAAAGERLKAL